MRNVKTNEQKPNLLMYYGIGHDFLFKAVKKVDFCDL